MKQAILAIFCGIALMASSVAYADEASDKEMADRYSQAAQAGDNEAQFNLGALYSAGVGRPRSDEEAFKWFSRAADQGHAHAMLVLAGLYAIGRGGPKDNVNAYKWAYIVSVGSKVDEYRSGSRQLMGVLETRMSSAEIGQAKTDAGRWRAVPSQARPAAAPADEVGKRELPSFSSPSADKQSPARPAASSTAETSPAPGPRSGKKDEMNQILDQVPTGLRKRFGF